MREADRAELRRALGKLARGLSILFWALPLTFLAYLATARAEWIGFFGGIAFAPSVGLNLALLFGLLQMRQFQKQERIWHHALNRAEILAIVNAGLAPFLLWWRRLPEVQLYAMGAGLLALTSLLFLMQTNRALVRLAAMIPDEALRAEINIFAGLNIWMLGAVFVAVSAYFAAECVQVAPLWLERVLELARERGLWALIFSIVLPLAMTMSLLWKIKETVFTGIFNDEP